MSGLENLKDKIKENIKRDLLKVKDGLKNETLETKEMMTTYMRFTQGEASKAEMKEANIQFRSFLKTIGLGAIAVLPFAPITIPLVVKLGRKLGIDVIPNSFK